MGVSRWWLGGVGGTPDTTMEAEAHRQLACSAYASPSKVYSVRGHEGRMVPLTIWPIRDLQSEFDDGWKVWDPHISNLEAGLPAEDLLSANARAAGHSPPLPFGLQGWGVDYRLPITVSRGGSTSFERFPGAITSDYQCGIRLFHLHMRTSNRPRRSVGGLRRPVRC
jgi:hypothetical protein